MNKEFIFILSALLFVFGCKKEDPIEETPVVVVEPTPEEPQDYGTFSQADMDLLDHVIDSVKNAHPNPIPGFVVGVYTQDRGVYKRPFGVANIQTGELMRVDAAFSIGSVNKLFKWVLGHKLIEDGIVDPNAQVNSYVSEPSVPGVTVMDLFKHSSGLPDIPQIDDLNNFLFINRYSDVSYDTVVSFIPFSNGSNSYGTFTNGFLDGFVVGSHGSYSSFGPLILKEIMENETDSSLFELMENYIYQPLGLENTSFIGFEPDPAKLTEGHDSYTTVYPHVPTGQSIQAFSSANGGAMHSDVNDLLLFTNGIFNGVLNGSTVSTMAVDTVQAPGMTIGQGIIQFNQWRQGDFWGHAGYGTRAHSSTVLYNADHNVSIVVLTNVNASLDEYELNYQISKAILETLY